MLAQVVLAAAVVIAAALVAMVIQRRRPDPPVQGGPARPGGGHVPVQLDRNDFADPTTAWLLLVFASETCESCTDAWTKAQALASPDVAVHRVDYESRRDLHDRYGIDSVPTLVLADQPGVVAAAFIGPPTAAELWAAVADVRDNHPDKRP